MSLVATACATHPPGFAATTATTTDSGSGKITEELLVVYRCLYG
jgi:hypothetical protein